MLKTDDFNLTENEENEDNSEEVFGAFLKALGRMIDKIKNWEDFEEFRDWFNKTYISDNVLPDITDTCLVADDEPEEPEIDKEMVQRFLDEEILTEGKSELEAMEKLMKIIGVEIPEAWK